MANSPLGVGLIGLGSIGRTHAQVLREFPGDFALRCFSGGSVDAAATAGWPDAVQLPPDAVPNHPEVELVLICSPSGDHPTRALYALEAGRHVVVEKPFAVNGVDADRVLRRAAARDRWIATIAQRRFEPVSIAVKSLLEQGMLGTLRMANVRVHWWRGADYYAAASWRGSMADGGGSAMNQGFHAIDLLRWLCGEVESVTAQYGTLAHDIEAEDVTAATVRFGNGALGLIGTSTATPPGDPASITLWFDRGVVELGDNMITRWDIEGVPEPGTESPVDGTADRPRITSGAADPSAIGLAGHLAQWQAIATAVRDGTTPPVPASDAAGTVRLLDAIYRAARTGRATRPEESR